MKPRNHPTRMRLAVLLLVLALTAVALSGCTGGRDPAQPTDTDPPTSSTEPGPNPPELDEQTRNAPQKKSWGTGTYRMYMDAWESESFFVYSELVSNDAVNTALYKRAALMEEYFGTTVTLTPDEKLAESILIYGNANEDYTDILLLGAASLMTSAVPQGMLMDLTGTNGLNLDASYWDQRIQSEYNINGSLYMLEGDFSVYDELRTMTILYNADRYRTKVQEKYGTPYALVNEGKWTYDTMMEMLRDTSEDLNGDGQMVPADDLYGLYSECAGPYVFFLGSGMKTANVTNGEISLLYSDNYSKIYSIFEKTVALCQDRDAVLVDRYSGIGYAAANDNFRDGKVLFRSTTLSSATSYRDMTSDFGILPIPKYTEEQDGYYCWVSASSSLPLSIPYTAKAHADATAALTEAFCYFSRYNPVGELTLYEAFFDRMAYNKLCRTPDDRAMLELVIQSKTYDIDSAAGLTDIYQSIWNLCAAGNATALSSTLEGLKDGAVGRLATYLATWKSNYRK